MEGQIQKDKTEAHDNLNDSIGSEFCENEEKSVYEKIRDQPNMQNKTLSSSIGNKDFKRMLNRGSTHRDFNHQTILNSNDQLKLHLSVNFTNTRNDSTEINSKKLTSYKNSSYKNSLTNSIYNSIYNSEELNLSNNLINASNNFDEKKKIQNLAKLKETEISDLFSKYESLKRKLNEKKKEYLENKTEFTKLKTINTNIKKMIVSLIQQKEDR